MNFITNVSSDYKNPANHFNGKGPHPLIDSIEPSKEIDLEQAERFLKLLDPPAEAFTYQTFVDSEDEEVKERLAHLTKVRQAPALTALVNLNGEGAGIYVTVNRTDGKGRTKENITAIRAVFQEDDGGGDFAFPLEPSMVVETSPGHFHRYWLVGDDWPADEQGRADFAGVMERMVESYGSDKNAKDITRVLRVPGFLHQKTDRHHVIKIVDDSGRRYTRGDIIRAFPKVERQKKTTGQRKDWRPQGDKDQRIKDALRYINADDRDIWLQVGMALNDHFGDAGRHLWDDWSQQSDKFDEREQDKTWRSFRRNGITIATLFHFAQEGGWKPKSNGRANRSTDRDNDDCEDDIKFDSHADHDDDDGDDDVGGRPATRADILVDLAKEAELFHDPKDIGYADIQNRGHRETWPIRSTEFKQWLIHRFYKATGGSPNSEAVQAALGAIGAMARFEGPERLVCVRVGEADNKLYLDLCDQAWRAVEIDGDGWRIIDSAPVRFRRTSGMKPLPDPARGGSIADLREFLNVKSDADFVMVVAWLLAAFRSRGPYPVLVLTGEQGSAKSTLSAILRSLIDPNAAPLRSLPKEIRDLFIAANNSHALVFDNLSSLPDWLSDALCRLATGGAFAVRQNYSDQDEMLFDAVRPIILNGIEDVATRPDLVERSIVSMLMPIDESNRKTEDDLRASFETARPRILGALLDAVSRGIERLPQTRMEKLPRMADFALWATACETAFCPPGTTFNSAYDSNRDNAVEIAIEASPLAAAVRSFMAGRTDDWTGTPSELLTQLVLVAGEGATKSQAWPKAANALSSKLRRTATDLRKIGIQIIWDRENTSRRITITQNHPPSKEDRKTSSRSSPPAGSRQSTSQNNGLGGDDPGDDVGDDPNDPETIVTGVVTPNPLKSNENDDGDDGDDKTRDHLEAGAVCVQCGDGPPDVQVSRAGKSAWLHRQCIPFYEGRR